MTVDERLAEARTALASAEQELEHCEMLCRSTLPSDETLQRRALLRTKIADLPELIQRLESQAAALRYGLAHAEHRRAVGEAEKFACDLVARTESEGEPVVCRILADLQRHPAEVSLISVPLVARLHEGIGALWGIHGCRDFGVLREDIAASATQRMAG